jgi:hypothetical protein
MNDHGQQLSSSRGATVAVLLICVSSIIFGQSPSVGHLALIGGTVYVSPTAAPITDGVILIENGKIAAVGRSGSVGLPRGVEILDCSGSTVTAGSWNSHVHFIEKKFANSASVPASQLTEQFREMFTQYGFTSVFDTGSNWQNTQRLRERIESGEVLGPRIRSTGPILLPRRARPFTLGVSLAMEDLGKIQIPFFDLMEYRNLRKPHRTSLLKNKVF